jgi:hypothetical protein
VSDIVNLLRRRQNFLFAYSSIELHLSIVDKRAKFDSGLFSEDLVCLFMRSFIHLALVLLIGGPSSLATVETEGFEHSGEFPLFMGGNLREKTPQQHNPYRVTEVGLPLSLLEVRIGTSLEVRGYELRQTDTNYFISTVGINHKNLKLPTAFVEAMAAVNNRKDLRSFTTAAIKKYIAPEYQQNALDKLNKILTKKWYERGPGY